MIVNSHACVCKNVAEMAKNLGTFQNLADNFVEKRVLVLYKQDLSALKSFIE